MSTIRQLRALMYVPGAGVGTARLSLTLDHQRPKNEPQHMIAVFRLCLHLAQGQGRAVILEAMMTALQRTKHPASEVVVVLHRERHTKLSKTSKWGSPDSGHRVRIVFKSSHITILDWNPKTLSLSFMSGTAKS